MNTFGANSPLTNLVPSLQDVDPDDAFSSVPYEKGFALLYHLEELMGGPGKTWTNLDTSQSGPGPEGTHSPVGSSSSEVFMGFVKSYIQLFAYGSVTTDEWKNYLFTYFKDKVRHTWTRKSTKTSRVWIVDLNVVSLSLRWTS